MRIMRIFWPNKVSNEKLLSRCEQECMGTITMRRWKWIGHVVRKNTDDNTWASLHWTPEGKKRWGAPINTLRKVVEAEMKEIEYTWGTTYLRKEQNERNGGLLLLPCMPRDLTSSKYVYYKSHSNFFFCCQGRSYKSLNKNMTNWHCIGGFHKVLVQRTRWSVIQKNLIRICFESHYLTSICHCVISSWDLVKPKNLNFFCDLIVNIHRNFINI